MPKAEVGSTKYLSNKLKSKGLQRLRFWCEVCHKQCRDDNGYKCHVMSESHTRAMQAVGANAGRVISDYSGQFQRNFLVQLRTAHGTKAIQLNRFYQEIIAEKEHVHMNSTRWNSLTEFAKHLGRLGLVRVEEVEDKGLHISWIDNSPETLRRQEALRKKERQDKGDEELEQQQIQEQIERAQSDRKTEEFVPQDLVRLHGEKIKLALGPKDSSKDPEKLKNPLEKPKNVFAAKKNALAGPKVVKESARPVSEAERIMKEEMERKRHRGFGPGPRALRT